MGTHRIFFLWIKNFLHQYLTIAINLTQIRVIDGAGRVGGYQEYSLRCSLCSSSPTEGATKQSGEKVAGYHRFKLFSQKDIT